MLEFNVIKSLDNQRVLLSEKTNKNNQVQERLYVVPENKIDKFIDSKKALKINSGLQKTLSFGLAGAVGIVAACFLKAPNLVRAAAGIGATSLTYLGCKKVDSFADNLIQKQYMKTLNVQDVTNQNVDEIV